MLTVLGTMREARVPMVDRDPRLMKGVFSRWSILCVCDDLPLGPGDMISSIVCSRVLSKPFCPFCHHWQTISVRNPKILCFRDGDAKRSNIADGAFVPIFETGTRVMELDYDHVYFNGALYCSGVGWTGLWLVEKTVSLITFFFQLCCWYA